MIFLTLTGSIRYTADTQSSLRVVKSLYNQAYFTHDFSHFEFSKFLISRSQTCMVPLCIYRCSSLMIHVTWSGDCVHTQPIKRSMSSAYFKWVTNKYDVKNIYTLVMYTKYNVIFKNIREKKRTPMVIF